MHPIHARRASWRGVALWLVLLAGAAEWARAYREGEWTEEGEAEGGGDGYVAYDGLTDVVRRKCDRKDGKYAKRHYSRCCGKGRSLDREAICEKAKPYEDPDLRTPAWPKVKPRVSDQCMACARMVDNFDMGLLPKLRDRHEQLARHHSRSKLARSAGVGALEEIVEEEVDRVCQYPRTHHNKKVRAHCWRLIEDHSEEIVDAVSRWAREKLSAMPIGALPAPPEDGSAPPAAEPNPVARWGEAKEGAGYTLPLDASLAEELRPEICAKRLDECTDYDLWELKDQDADERTKLESASLMGHAPDKPLETQPVYDNQEGPLTIIVAADFIERVVERGEDKDYLVYFYFPGRWNETNDTHSKLRRTYMRLAQLMDAPSSNGTLQIGWMDCVWNQIPYPHGLHIYEDTVVMYAAGRAQKASPNYLSTLRDGEVELHGLIQFISESCSNIATYNWVEARRAEMGERVLREGIEYLNFTESLLTDETQMEIDNLTELREGFYARALGGPDPRNKNELPAPDEEAEPPGEDSPGEDKEEL